MAGQSTGLASNILQQGNPMKKLVIAAAILAISA
jgi:hypothetical protein